MYKYTGIYNPTRNIHKTRDHRQWQQEAAQAGLLASAPHIEHIYKAIHTKSRQNMTARVSQLPHTSLFGPLVA